mgnify:CR=1 FL=1
MGREYKRNMRGKNMDNNMIYENYDVAVVGAGHAGCEAARLSACARKE